MRKKEKQ